MKFKIWNTKYNDYFLIEVVANDDEDLTQTRDKVYSVMASKGWKEEDCFSEEVRG
jgi:hypothetical protein